jgi:hypothetical protein
VNGAPGSGTRVTSVFNAAGRVVLIAATAAGDTANGIGAGATMTALLKHRARRLAPGLWAGRRLAAGARYLYGVRGGRVRYVADASQSELHSIARLRSDLRAAGV